MPLRFAALVLFTASMAAPLHAAVDDSMQLPRYHWVLDSAHDQAGTPITALFVRRDKPPQLDFDGNRLSIANACNALHGDYSIKGHALDISPMVQTRMACPDPAWEGLDTALTQRLSGRLRFDIGTADDIPTLQLVTPLGDVLRLRGEPTAQTRFGSDGETVFLEVAAKPMRCSRPMMPRSSCLRVREIQYDANGIRQDTPGAWQPFYATIEGYRHEEGVRNVLRVTRYALAHPAADGGSRAYVLDLVVESERTSR